MCGPCSLTRCAGWVSETGQTTQLLDRSRPDLTQRGMFQAERAPEVANGPLWYAGLGARESATWCQHSPHLQLIKSNTTHAFKPCNNSRRESRALLREPTARIDMYHSRRLRAGVRNGAPGVACGRFAVGATGTTRTTRTTERTDCANVRTS